MITVQTVQIVIVKHKGKGGTLFNSTVSTSILYVIKIQGRYI